MKKIIRLTESDLTRIVKKVLKEQSLSDLGKLPKTSKNKDPKCKKGDCKNGYGEHYWDNDNYYKGNYKNGQFDGYGELKRSKSGPTDESGYGDVNGDLYKGQFKNGDENGYGTLKLDTGGVYKGNFDRGAGEGYGVFTNRYGRVFKGRWMSAAGFTILKVASEFENKQYGNMNIYDLENVGQFEDLETKKCVVPPTGLWLTADFDKNYEYENGGKEFGFCWWARNVNNGKVFNLSELVKTNPKIQKSIDILNKEYLDKYSI